MSIPKLSTFNAFKNCSRELEGDIESLAGNTFDMLVATVLQQGFRSQPRHPQMLPSVAEKFQELTEGAENWTPNSRAICTSIRRLTGRFLTVTNYNSNENLSVRPDSPGLARAAGYAAVAYEVWQRNNLAFPQALLGSVKSSVASTRFGTLRLLQELNKPLTSAEIGKALKQRPTRMNNIGDDYAKYGIVDITPHERQGLPRSLKLTETFQAPVGELISGMVSLATPGGLENANEMGSELLLDNKAFSTLLNFSESDFGRGTSSNP